MFIAENILQRALPNAFLHVAESICSTYHPCGGNGDCVDLGPYRTNDSRCEADYTCDCYDGFSGTNCEGEDSH